MDLEKLVFDLNKFTTAVYEIQNHHENEKKSKKKNFNFFRAVVSGKNDKAHIEKYHSNFIASLLKPNGSHNFGDLFLKHFINTIITESAKTKNYELDTSLKTTIIELKKLVNENKLQNFDVERERKTTEGRYIDISIECGKQWIIFIENKIMSPEGFEQMKDYREFAKIEKFNHGIGIYITLSGYEPQSINGLTGTDIPILSLSYLPINEWLNKCLNDKEIQKHTHIESIIEQYVLIIKNLLKEMEEDKKDILKYLNSNLSEVCNIVEYQSLLNGSIRTLVQEVRVKFYDELCKKVSSLVIEDEKSYNFKVIIHQGKLLYDGDEEHTFGLGFQILKDNKGFNYGGSGFGHTGNGIRIGEINAHYAEGIDQANALLLRNYKNPEEWENLVNSSADIIMNEILEKVIPRIKMNSAK